MGAVTRSKQGRLDSLFHREARHAVNRMPIVIIRVRNLFFFVTVFAPRDFSPSYDHESRRHYLCFERIHE